MREAEWVTYRSIGREGLVVVSIVGSSSEYVNVGDDRAASFQILDVIAKRKDEKGLATPNPFGVTISHSMSYPSGFRIGKVTIRGSEQCMARHS